MTADEIEIRQLVETWQAATRAGDTDTVLSLMADDAVFLQPGQPVMRRQDFAAAANAQQGSQRPAIEFKSDIQEITVAGDVAYMWTALAVVITPPGSSTPITRAGDTLTILRKEHGRWVLARDANLLVRVDP